LFNAKSFQAAGGPISIMQLVRMLPVVPDSCPRLTPVETPPLENIQTVPAGSFNWSAEVSAHKWHKKAPPIWAGLFLK